MAVAFTNEAETIALKNFLNILAPEDIVIKLYSNNKTPGHTDVVGGYTEVSGGGYTSVSMVPGSWSVSAGDPSQAQYPQIEATTAQPLKMHHPHICLVLTLRAMWFKRLQTR
jgi:hypothetical protein